MSEYQVACALALNDVLLKADDGPRLSLAISEVARLRRCEDELAAANTRAADAVLALIQYQERIRRFEARLQREISEGTAESAAHAGRWARALGEEMGR